MSTRRLRVSLTAGGFALLLLAGMLASADLLAFDLDTDFPVVESVERTIERQRITR